MLNVFDTGILFYIPTDGDLTPVRIGGLQEVTLDMDFDIKAVRGQLKYPLKFTTGLNGIKGSSKTAVVDGDLLFRVAFGKQGVAGSLTVNLDQVITVPASSPYQVMIFPPSGGTFAFDLGVQIVIGGTTLRRVAGAPSGTDYQVVTVGPGTPKYVFGSSLAGGQVRISYAYDSPAGHKLVLQNDPMWLAPTMGMMLFQKFGCKSVSFWLPSVVAEKFLWPSRLEEYTIPNLDFQVQQDSTGEIGTFSVID